MPAVTRYKLSGLQPLSFLGVATHITPQCDGHHSAGVIPLAIFCPQLIISLRESPQMSTAVAVSVPQPKPLELVHDRAATQTEIKDEYPLLSVFVAGVIALVGAVAFVGTIVVLLALRYSGVLAP